MLNKRLDRQAYRLHSSSWGPFVPRETHHRVNTRYQYGITHAANFIIELQSSHLLYEWVMFAFGQDMHIKAHSAEMLKPNNG